MTETKLLLLDITKVLDTLPENETKYELENLFNQLTQEIETQQQFIEGATDFLNQTKQLDKAKEHAIIYTDNKQWSDIKADRAKMQSRGVKAPYGGACTTDLEFLFDDLKFELENQSN